MTGDAVQRAIIEAPATDSAVVIGAPGTGKTVTLIERVVGLLAAGAVRPEEVLVLTPSRRAATALRDRIGVRIAVATPGPLARSLGSFAFHLVRGAMVHAGGEPPALLTGAEQDRIIAELLAGDAEDGVIGWPENVPAVVRSSKDFRSELRALLAETTEMAATSAELRALGDPAWSAVADFLDEYRAVLDGMRFAHRDAADLLAEAAAILQRADGVALGPFAGLRAVVIDDAQELTRGGIEVIRALHARGVAVLAFGDPDISSGAFRGASAELFDELSRLLGKVRVLEVSHRQAPALTALTRTLTQAIGVGGRVEHRRPPPVVSLDDAAAGVRTYRASSPHDEIDRIAGTLRQWHLDTGVGWEQMAVIAHDARQVTLLEAELAARDVPTRAAGVQRPLGGESAVRDIVGVVQLAVTPTAERTASQLEEALCSPFGGMDPIGLRRLRTRLRHLELADGGSTAARELLRQAMEHPAHFVFIDAPEARDAARFAETLAEVSAAAQRGESIHELLWRVWERARSVDGRSLAAAWGEAALLPEGAETARALDALVALFDAAKRSVERSPHDRPERFVRDILDSEVPEDSLSIPEGAGHVTLLTPATALGREFDAVVVAGVQDGIWPNIRLRGGLLQTWRLADALGAARTGNPARPPEALDRRRGALHDELRLFVRAVSRARTRVLITAVDDDALTPSPFFAFLPPPEETPHPSADHPLTLRGLVARHRRTLTTSTSLSARQHAAEQLAVMAAEQVPGADPAQWYGVAGPSTTAPVHDLSTAPARVSPSRLESFEECGLNWAISALGGDTVSPPSAGIGTIVHEALEQVPDGDDRERMRSILAQRWPELEFEAEWIGRKQRRRAEEIVDRVHAYAGAVVRDGGRVLGSEVRFDFAIGITTDPDAGEEETPVVTAIDAPTEGPRVVVSGSIDRIESYPPGAGEHPDSRARGWEPMVATDAERVVVVDLKTGTSDPDSDSAVAGHAQLAAYQVAVQEGLIDGASPEALAGARLLIVSKDLARSPYRLAHQHALDTEQRAAFLRRVVAAARGMSAASFTAHVETHCSDTRRRIQPCRVHTVPAVSS